MRLLRWLAGWLRLGAESSSKRCRPAVEPLEPKSVPSGLTLRYQIDDPTGQFAAYPLMQANLNAAGQILSELLEGRGTLEVRVRPTATLPRAGGTTVAVTFAQHGPAYDVWENGTITEARTGVDPNGAEPDLDVYFNAQQYLPLMWFDPSGAARTGAVPADKTDFVTVALHETLHGLGIQGYRQIQGPNQGTFPLPYRTTYDQLTSFGAGGDAATLYFTGAKAAAAYGGPVPLISVPAGHRLNDLNWYQLGNPPGRPGADLAGDLMNGLAFQPGTRYHVSDVDLGILQDMGWRRRGAADPALPQVPAGSPPAVAPPVAGDVTHLIQIYSVRLRVQPRSRRLLWTVWLVNAGGLPVQGPLRLEASWPNARFRRGGPPWRSSSEARRSLPIAVETLRPGEMLITTLDLGRWSGPVPRPRPRLVVG